MSFMNVLSRKYKQRWVFKGKNKSQNNIQISSKQVWKCPDNDFFPLKDTHKRRSQKFKTVLQISTLQVTNQLRSLKLKPNQCVLSSKRKHEQLPSNFEDVRNYFFASKIGQYAGTNFDKKGNESTPANENTQGSSRELYLGNDIGWARMPSAPR